MSSALLFKTAAVLCAICIPGHTAMGFKTVHPALNSIPTVGRQERKIAQRGAQNAWNYFNASLLITGMKVEEAEPKRSIADGVILQLL